MKKADILISKLLECQDVAIKKQRYRTMHKIDDAIEEAGWELADILTGKQKIGLRR